MIYAHFIIRDDKLYMTAETRGTAVSMGFINDIFFLTLMQEILLGWIQEYYPEVEMGTFLYKTVSLHTYVNEIQEHRRISRNGKYVPTWDQTFISAKEAEHPISKCPPINLTYNEFVEEMGILYHYVDTYMKATPHDDIDSGNYITYDDCQAPDENLFKTSFFLEWAKELYNHTSIKKQNYERKH